MHLGILAVKLRRKLSLHFRRHSRRLAAPPAPPRAMPHLPFSSSLASYTVVDERGAFATHDVDGRIVSPSSLLG